MGDMIENINILGGQRRSLSKERTFVLRCKCHVTSHTKIKGRIPSTGRESTKHKIRQKLGVLEELKEGSVLEHSGVREPGAPARRGL